MKSRLFQPKLVGFAVLALYMVLAVWVHLHVSDASMTRTVTIRLAHWQNEVGPAAGLNAVIARYEELNPHVRVKQMVVPPTVYRQWLRTNFVGDNAADIVEYGAWLQGMSDIPVRYFAPITGELQEPNPYNRGTALEGVPWLKTFTDELLEQRMNSPEPGQYYAVTLARGSFRLFSNRQLLREVTGSDQAPTTLIELRAVAERVAAYSRARHRPVALFAGSKETATLLMGMYLMGTTSRMVPELDRDGLLSLYAPHVLGGYLQGKWDFQRPALLAGLTLLREFSEQMKPGFQQLSRDEAMREFLQGDALFIFAQTGTAMTLYEQAPFRVDALRAPQPTKDDPVVGPFILGPFADGNDMTSFGFYLNKRSPLKAEAIDFMRFLASQEGNALFSAKSGWPPSIRGVPMSPEIAAFVSPADGYMLGISYFSGGGNSRDLLARNLYRLTGPQGSPAKLATALDEQMPAAARADLAALTRDAWLAALPQDARIAAVGGLVRAQPEQPAHLLAREQLEAAQNQSEARALMLVRQLQLTAKAREPAAGPLSSGGAR